MTATKVSDWKHSFLFMGINTHETHDVMGMPRGKKIVMGMPRHGYAQIMRKVTIEAKCVMKIGFHFVMGIEVFNGYAPNQKIRHGYAQTP